jgi:tetraacyldisaccharide 4'-kinase
MGGTGKTPFVEFLARRFRFEGRTPAILSRGYGRRSTGVVVVSRREGPRHARRGRRQRSRSPGPLRRSSWSASRADAGRRAADLGADLLILDDCFQHLAVRRDVDLLLLDARDPFGGGRFPPRGRLREPVAALRRADAIVLTRVNRGDPPRAALDEIARLHPAAPVFHARIRAASLRDETGASLDAKLLATRRGLGVCGIANSADSRRRCAS